MPPVSDRELRSASVEGASLVVVEQPRSRITQLDGIRAIAIIAVYLDHACDVRLFWSGVDLFFVLSGFLITGILLEQKKKRTVGSYFGHFYERRARRILLPYLLLLVFTSVFVSTAWMRYGEFYLFGMNLLKTLHIEQPQPLDPLWSLAVEEQFYLFWPLVVFWLSEDAVLWAAIGLVCAAPALRWLFTPLFTNLWPIYEMTPFRMDCLAAGAVLAIVWHRRREWILRFGVYGPIVSVLAGVLLLKLSRLSGYLRTENTRKSNTLIYELTMLASVGLILWALSGRFVGVLQWAPLRYLGRISYTVYLIHIFALGMVGRYVHGRTEVALVAAAGTLVYAALSWQFLEKPLLGTKPNEASVVLEPAMKR